MTSTDGARTRTVDVWYPADPVATGTPSRYSLDAFPSLFSESTLALDHVPVAKGGPFPLVVYSHGSGGVRFIASFFTEVLASHGFVVASADHTGDTVLDVLAGHAPTDAEEPAIIASRVADVSLVTDGVIARSSANGDLLAGSVDPTRIGITGHSFGGLTAFAAVGGVGAVSGTPIERDARFKAIVTMDATPGLLGPHDLAAITVPSLSIVGADLPPGASSFWHGTKAAPFLEVRLDNAAHLAFTDICHYQELAHRLTDAPDLVVNFINGLAGTACSPPNMTPDRVHQLTDQFAIAFLETHLAGDTRYESFLNANTSSEPDVHVSSP